MANPTLTISSNEKPSFISEETKNWFDFKFPEYPIKNFCIVNEFISLWFKYCLARSPIGALRFWIYESETLFKIFKRLGNLISESAQPFKTAKEENTIADLEKEILRLKKQIENSKNKTSSRVKNLNKYSGEVDENGYIDDDRVEKLRAFRLEMARIDGVSAFIVFTNKELNSILHFNPKNLEELENIHGFSSRKIAEYGDGILKIINENN